MQYTLAHSVPQEAKCCYRQTTRRLSVRNLPGSSSPRLNRPTARVSFPLCQGNRTMRASLPEVEITHRVSPFVLERPSFSDRPRKTHSRSITMVKSFRNDPAARIHIRWLPQERLPRGRPRRCGQRRLHVRERSACV